MITLDGSAGEGGGQILRTALSLSACTGQPFSIHSIRAKRKKPGLMRQHLTAVQAAAEVCGADVEGAAIGSCSLTFRPGPVCAGDYSFAVGTAGSTTLVLQTVLPPLVRADAASTIEVHGGTHNPWCPPFDFLARCFAPQLRRCGVELEFTLHRAGFYPAGGGRLTANVKPAALGVLSLSDRGALVRRIAIARFSNLPANIAKRELDVVRKKLGFADKELRIEEFEDAIGPGNCLTIEHEFENVAEVTTGFGERGVSAERVARSAVRHASAYLQSDAPVGEYLADQLLIPIALAGAGEYRTVEPSMHTRTNCEVIERFLPVRLVLREDEASATWVVSVESVA